MRSAFRIGTAGWPVPSLARDGLAPGPSLLARYASRFTFTEINSTFYRFHRPATLARWAASVPETFRFAVKMPKVLSHAPVLRADAAMLARLQEEIAPLGAKTGPLLLQFPPGRVFAPAEADRFLEGVRRYFPGELACEARHPGWFTAEAAAFFRRWKVSAVIADPLHGGSPAAVDAGGFVYARLHGSPLVYRSSYDPAALAAWAARLRAAASGRPVWCVFDNTAAGAAWMNAALFEGLIA